GMIQRATLRLPSAARGARRAQAARTSTERPAAVAAGANRLLACEYSAEGGVLRISAQVEDSATLRMVQRAQAEGPMAAGIVPVAGALATQISAQAKPYVTRSQDAVRAYAEG